MVVSIGFLFIILTAGLLFPELFRKFKLPYVTSVILAGSILGPHGYDYVQSDEVIEFFGFLGSVFLMLMAGLEVKLSIFEKIKRKLYALSFMNALFPALIGFLVVQLLGFGLIESAIIAIVFISSSIAVVIPAIEDIKLNERKIGQAIIGSVILADIASLVLLAIFLQSVAPQNTLSLPAYILIVGVSIIALKKYIPKLYRLYKQSVGKGDLFEKELRFILILLIATIGYFELLGMHAIIAGFFVGLLLSDIIKTEQVHHKIHTMGYGMFVPVFFFIVGMEMDLGIFLQISNTLVIVMAIVLSLIISKFLSGWFGGHMIGFNNTESLLIGSATIPQLSTSLVVVFSAASLGLLSKNLVSAIIVLSIVTTLITPIIFRRIASHHNIETNHK